MNAPAFTPGPWERPTDLGIVSTSAARINKNGRAIRQRVALLDYKGLDQVTIDANAALIVAAPGVGTKPANYPANAEAGMIKNDLGWMADNRDRVLAEWSKRYESKAAPKN